MAKKGWQNFQLPLAEIRHWHPIVRYVLAAIFARAAIGGSAVAIVLLAREQGASGNVVGLLTACLTVPHIFGPVYGRWLDKGKDPRRLLSLTALGYGLFFQFAILGFDSLVLPIIVPTLLVCGVCSAFLMGGLSTQLVFLSAAETKPRRRAQSWDIISYGIGGTLGPMLIAFLTAAQVPLSVAIAVVMALPAVAGSLILCFPPKPQNIHQGKPLFGHRQILQTFAQTAELRQTLLMSSAAAFSLAVLPILAVYLTEYWQLNQRNSAQLITLYGLGNLSGAVAMIFRPAAAEALTFLKNTAIALILALLFIAFSQTFSTAMLAYWLCGVANAAFFAATLAARTEYAPKQGLAQVYMWVAAAKITATSIGALVAGYLIDATLNLPLILAIGLLAMAFLCCFAWIGGNKKPCKNRA